MDCRAFHRNLEDYLENSLDFSGRFGMERHAQQCIRCGKEMAAAQRLHQMASELERVKAPLDFEASVLNEIGIRKSHGRFSGIRSFWMFRFEWPSWRRLALASSSLAVLGLGIFYSSHRAGSDLASAPPAVVVEPAKKTDRSAKIIDAKGELDANVGYAFSKKPTTRKAPKAAKAIQPVRPPKPEYLPDPEATETEFVEYLVVGPDDRPMPIRLPKRIRMQYGQASEEYFIRNVSH